MSAKRNESINRCLLFFKPEHLPPKDGYTSYYTIVGLQRVGGWAAQLAFVTKYVIMNLTDHPAGWPEKGTLKENT